MQMIKWATEVMEGNVREARSYALKTYDFREKSKPASDWCREMAAAHLTFNAAGAALVKKLMDERRAADTSERMAGMLEVWADRQAGVARESAEVRAMLDCIK